MFLFSLTIVHVCLHLSTIFPNKEPDTYTIDFKESSNAFSRLDVDNVHPKRTLLCPEMTVPSGIAWFHNGRRMNSSKSTISIIVPEGSHTENVIGVYQCFVFNSTHEFSETYKVELSREFHVLSDHALCTLQYCYN